MKRRAFVGSGPEIEARYQRAGQWLRAALYDNVKAQNWCLQNGVPLVKAASEGVASSGGFLVPADLANAILDLRDIYGAFRRGARLVPMASDSTTAPRRTGGTTTFFMGENNIPATSFESSTNGDMVNLTAKKIGTLIKLSNELNEDAAVDMVDYIANEIALAFAVQEDDCAFNGTGASTYGKMLGVGPLALDGNHNRAKVTAAAGHNTFGTAGSAIDSTDIGNLIARVRASAVPNAAWYCSQTCLALTFARIVSAGGGYMESRPLNGVITPYYLGFPVILCQKMPLVTTTLSGAMMLAFGDMYAAGILGQRRAITLSRSEDRYMDADQIGVLGTQRFHSVIHDMGDNTNNGSLAVLVGG